MIQELFLIQNKWNLWTSVLTFGFLLATGWNSGVTGQEVRPAAETPQVPQPWRPSFGPVNGSNAEQATAATPVTGQAAKTDLSSIPVAPTASSANPSAQATSPVPGSPVKSAAGNVPASDLESSSVKVTRTVNSLPNSAGQVWREYDISPYTSRVTNTDNPQQAIIDWILKETGTEMWFNQPLGILSATKTQLYVYHTPEIQDTVHRLVDRFVYTKAQVQSVDITLLTVDNPNWRTTAYPLMQPVLAKSVGVEGFILSKENAAMLIHELNRRPDVKLVNSGSVNNHDGQPFLLRNTRLTQFFNRLQWVPNQTPNYQPLTANINEGYSVSINCLSSLDSRTIEAIIKCDIDQVERLTNVNVNAPGGLGGNQGISLQIPQIVSWRMHERFRWSNDQVLLLTCGIVSGIDPNGSRAAPAIPFLPNNLRTKRAEALLFIDYRGPTQEANLPRASRDGMVPIPSRR
jgi:hypothetical protein